MIVQFLNHRLIRLLPSLASALALVACRRNAGPQIESSDNRPIRLTPEPLLLHSEALGSLPGAAYFAPAGVVYATTRILVETAGGTVVLRPGKKMMLGPDGCLDLPGQKVAIAYDQVTTDLRVALQAAAGDS